MEVIAQVKDREIRDVIDPSKSSKISWILSAIYTSIAVAAFTPLLKAKEAFIKEIPFKSFKYGPSDRHHVRTLLGHLIFIFNPSHSWTSTIPHLRLPVQIMHRYSSFVTGEVSTPGSAVCVLIHSASYILALQHTLLAADTL